MDDFDQFITKLETTSSDLKGAVSIHDTSFQVKDFYSCSPFKTVEEEIPIRVKAWRVSYGCFVHIVIMTTSDEYFYGEDVESDGTIRFIYHVFHDNELIRLMLTYIGMSPKEFKSKISFYDPVEDYRRKLIRGLGSLSE